MNNQLKMLLVYPTQVTETPITFGMLASILREENLLVYTAINTFKMPLSIEHIVNIAKALGVTHVGITMVTFQVLKTYTLIKALKEKGLTVVVGGAHASACPDEVITNGADIVVRGEGEWTLRELCKAWKLQSNENLSHIPGISYKNQDGQIVHSPARPRGNLDDLPLPALDVFDHELFRGDDGLVKGFHRVYTSRGCPGKCTFCDWHVFGQRLNYFSNEKVIEDIKRRAEHHGITSFSIADDCFTVNKKRVFDFCEKISKITPKVAWRINSRANLVNSEMLRAMKSAGCYYISFGLESGDPETLKKIRKGVRLEDNYRAPREAAEAGMKVYACLMTGFPWERPSHVDNTIKLIRGIMDSVYLFQVSGSLMPFPGNEIYNEYAQEYGFHNFWIRPEYQDVSIQTYQNSLNPYACSTYYQRHLFDDSYIQEDCFFRYSDEYKIKVKELVWEIGRHNARVMFPGFVERTRVLAISRASMALYNLFPRVEKRVGKYLFKNKVRNRSSVEKIRDRRRGIVRNKEDL